MSGMADHRPQPLCKYLPIVDGDVIQDIPTKMIAQGRFAKYVCPLPPRNVLMDLDLQSPCHGWAHHERWNWIHWISYPDYQRHSAIFGFDHEPLHPARKRFYCQYPCSSLTHIAPQSKEMFNKALALYPVSSFSSYYDMAQTLVGNTEFTCLGWFIANKTASYGVPAFNYR